MSSVSAFNVNMEFMKGLIWVAVFMAISGGVMNFTSLAIIDFIHGNPHRSQNNAIEMMAFFTPLFALVAFVGIFIVFSASQLVQAISANLLLGHFGHKGLYGFAFIIPLTTITAWYCFDYLTPSNFYLAINEGPDWVPYQHGLTARRYLITLGIQTPITLFTLLYLGLDAGSHRRARKFLILSLLAAAAIVGVFWGYAVAKQQFQFL